MHRKRVRLNHTKVELEAAKIIKLLMKPSVSVKERIRSSLTAILKYLKADKGSFMLLHVENEDQLVVIEALNKGEGNIDLIGKTQRKWDEGSVSSWVLKNKELLFVKDILKDKRFSNKESFKYKMNYMSNSIISLPFIDHQGKVIGVMNVTDKLTKDGIFTKDDIKSAVIFSESIAPIISYIWLNEQLFLKNKKLLELQRVKEELTNMVIHDLKGFVSEIISNIDILTYNEALSSYHKECIDTALEGCKNLMRFILNLLDINKMEEGKVILKYSEFDILALIREKVDSAHNLAARNGLNINILNNKGEDIKVSADKVFIERVIDNLLLNAISYSRLDTAIDISVAVEDRYVRVSIADHGYGVPPELKDKIFEKFEQGHIRKSESTGLGLTFCKMAIEAHKGHIWVESEIDKGSTFIFSMPKGV